jgi:hypothetical protein
MDMKRQPITSVTVVGSWVIDSEVPTLGLFTKEFGPLALNVGGNALGVLETQIDKLKLNQRVKPEGHR